MLDKNTSECEQSAGANTALAMVSQYLIFLEELERSWPHLKWRLGFSGPGDEFGVPIPIQEGAGFVMYLDCVTDCLVCLRNLSQAKELLRKLMNTNK